MLFGISSVFAVGWQTLESDVFDAADIGFEAAVQVPANVNPANTQFVRDFDWTTITTPVLPTLPDSNGRALKTEVNTFDGAAQRQFALYDPGVADYAVEARILPYIADGQTSATTEFVGIGIRMNDTFTEGYILQIRTDFSATFGSYAQLLRISPSTPAGSDILARIFYRQGSNYATFDDPNSLPNFIPGAKPIIRSPESNVQNTWTTVRLEAIGNTIRVFVDDDTTPRVTFVDPTPFATGKAAVFHQDSFPSSVNASDRVLALYDYFTVETPIPAAIDGIEADVEPYVNADNSAAGVDTNTRDGFGDSAKVERVVAYDTNDYIQVFVEGSQHSGNRMYLLIDSDANSSTGWRGGAITGATFGEADGLALFGADSVFDGGWDLVVSVGSSGENPPNTLYHTVLAINADGSINTESFLGSTGTAGGTLLGTIRGNAADLIVGYTPGDGVDNGHEYRVPRSWMLNLLASTQYRVGLLTCNGGNNFFSNSTIPQNGSTDNLGGTAPITGLTGLTAPVFTYTSTAPTSVESWMLFE